VNATIVHGIGGLWGFMGTALFADPVYVKDIYNNTHAGLITTGSGWLFLSHFIAFLCVFVWTSVWCFGIFGVLKYLNYIRVSETVEQYGLDLDHVQMNSKQKKVLAGNNKVTTVTNTDD